MFRRTFSLTLLARSSSILSWIRFLRYSSNAKGSAIALAWKEIHRQKTMLSAMQSFFETRN